MTVGVSGSHYDLVSGGYSATISTVGATVRSLRYEERDLIVSFSADEPRPFFRGALLAPWPNRVTDGRYRFAGLDQQLSITEPARGHALHGLVAWLDFAVAHYTADELVLRTTIYAQPGYPHLIDITVTFTLDDEGLLTTVVARNVGPSAAPFGVGPHPYLVAGEGHVDDWILDLPADKVLTVTPDRLVPRGLVGVASRGHEKFDFRAARPISATFIDNAYTDLKRDETGTARVSLLSPSGTGVSMSWGPECKWVQIHTADRPEAEFNRIGLAVEPMTCPPDAFNSGINLGVIEPGEMTAASWNIAAI